MPLKNQIFSEDYNYSPGLNTGIKPAVVYPIDPVSVKKKSLPKGPVTVQAGQQVDTKISKYNRSKSDKRQIGNALAAPTARKPCVQQSGVDKPGDQ